MTWLKKKSVLIPIDFSEASYQAIAPAKEYVEELSSLKLIHVLAPLHPADPAAIWGTLSDDERKQKVQEFLTQKLSEMGYEGAQIEVAIGDPANKIIDYSQTVEADLIVMSSHDRKEISRLLLGSVAERVVRLAHCPVLILK
ncbi:MAG: universal stress protein [Leptolyngbya sp. SIO1D8]|nr:universal stress protein [Leptolyngbya sp. SIO1D8]